MIVINSLQFKTKKSAEDYVRSQIYTLGACTINPSDPEFALFKDLVSFKYDDRVPIKFTLFKTEMSITTLHMRVHFEDESIITSWKDCARKTNTVESVSTQLNNAMRHAIIEDCMKFKYNNIDGKCVICKSTDNIQTDHIEPFSKIKDSFLATQTNSPSTFDLETSINQTVFKASDINFANLWVEYHRKHASFQLLCRTCNLKKGNKIAHLKAVAKYESKDEVKNKKQIRILKIQKQKAIAKVASLQRKIDLLAH